MSTGEVVTLRDDKGRLHRWAITEIVALANGQVQLRLQRVL